MAFRWASMPWADSWGSRRVRRYIGQGRPRPLYEFFGSQRALEAFGDLALKPGRDPAGFVRIVHDENRFHLSQ